MTFTKSQTNKASDTLATKHNHWVSYSASEFPTPCLFGFKNSYVETVVLVRWRVFALLFFAVVISSFIPTVCADEKLDFFEARIRPALVEHCLECHSAETEASGGLLLDSYAGWQAGGDSGSALVPGDIATSRLLKAISYDDPQLQMPPEGKLPDSILKDFTQWVREGAVDPRETVRPPSKKQIGMLVEQAQEHWAYRDVRPAPIPVESPESGRPASPTPVDAFVNQRLGELGLKAAPLASSDVLVRRLYFDLLGLPPTPNELQQAIELLEGSQQGYGQLVDQLLRTTQYGEHFARKWMDVARYADSVTLRGFVLPEAWRYRDYLVQAFTDDRPFDQMVREQVAGDLLPSENLQQQHSQLVATGFLVMGNTNLEQQDKTQLEMDHIDEQLEVIGRAFLGQTIGCARCHDHKFDPIPTRDYYALAGIMRSTVALEHDNVSKWVEQPLPLSEAEELVYQQQSTSLEQVKKQIAKLGSQIHKQPGITKKSISVLELPGIVIDDSEAKLVGTWTQSVFVGPYVGAGYLHDVDSGKGQKTATFEPSDLEPGQYEVRLTYTPGTNRASNTMVRVFSADGEATIHVDQRQKPPIAGQFLSLGNFRFEKDGQAFVLVSNADSDGHVVVDAVQFLIIPPVAQVGAVPSGDAARINNASDRLDGAQLAVDSPDLTPEQVRVLEVQLKKLEVRRTELEKRIADRPRYLTLVEQLAPRDIPIHIRGDVHNLGQTVPRGFLTAFNREDTPSIAAQSSGRVELAQWLSSSSNPLTARVYANRVWSWLMGQGLVSSVNNFGTTGTPPSNAELLDWLASELVRSNWSTKHLVRTIILSEAYRRQVVEADERQREMDPGNVFYWRGQSRRLSAESIRDAMLRISGELDMTVGGSLIRGNTKADYNYPHTTTRRSIYHPVFRNSLPELFEAFDFADTSLSIGQRPRSTVATQALVLLNHPWVAKRAEASATRLREEYGEEDLDLLVQGMYRECLSRIPTDLERENSLDFLNSFPRDESTGDCDLPDRFQILVHSLFASLDFRYLD